LIFVFGKLLLAKYTFEKTAFSQFQSAISFSTILMQDKSFKKNYVVKGTVCLTFNPSTDALFVHTDISLNIMR
jgi:hypothetical protein